MLILLSSLVAGLLSVLTPCTLTVLPVVLGGSVGKQDKKRPLIVIASLSVSILVFTILVYTVFNYLEISDLFRKVLSGGILVIIGIFTLFPNLWSWLNMKLKTENLTGNYLNKVGNQNNFIGEILTGAALGPVFTTCSPTFGYILSVILGTKYDFLFGILNILVFILGLSLILFVVAILGQKAVKKLRWSTDPESTFRKAIGLILIGVGIFIILGIDKQIATYLGNLPLFKYFDVTRIDQSILDSSK